MWRRMADEVLRLNPFFRDCVPVLCCFVDCFVSQVRGVVGAPRAPSSAAVLFNGNARRSLPTIYDLSTDGYVGLNRNTKEIDYCCRAVVDICLFPSACRDPAGLTTQRWCGVVNTENTALCCFKSPTGLDWKHVNPTNPKKVRVHFLV